MPTGVVRTTEMTAKAILVLCAQALLIPSALTQCLGRAGLVTPYAWGRNWGQGLGINTPYNWGNLGYDGLYGWPAKGLGCTAPLDFTPTRGGSLVVTSASAIPPVGISIVSDNAFEGILAVAGEVPFVGTTGMEGALPTAGAGAISYGCGSGLTAMVTDLITTIGGFGSAFGLSAITPAIGFGSGGCGCW